MVYQLIRYPGSKSKVLDLIYSYFPKSFDTYLEPFGGSFSVVLNLPVMEKYRKGLLSKKQMPILNANDINDDVLAIAETLLFEPDRLYRSNKIIYSNGLKKKLINMEPKDTFQKALKFLYLAKTSFGSMVTEKKIGYSYSINSENKTTPIYKSKDVIKEIHERLSIISFFNESWEIFLSRFVKKIQNGFIYLDPPYYNAGEKVYAYGKIDHVKLADYLSNLDERINWMLSYDNCEEIRKLYSDFYLFPVEWEYTLRKHGGEKVIGKELIITNYDPSKGQTKQSSLMSLLDEPLKADVNNLSE